MGVDIGRLRHRIMLQRRSGALDAFGQPVNDWVDVDMIWADIRPVSGREQLRKFVPGWELTHTVLIRYDRRFMPLNSLVTWRILFDDRIFSISSPLDFDERKKFVILECIENGPDGS